MSKTPLVSVIMPAWNARDSLSAAIASVQAQTLDDWELLLVVDAATDDTLDIAKAFAREDSRIRVMVNQKNLGVGPTRNIALEQARGQYVAFLDSDDRWLSKKLAKQCALLQQTGCAVSYTTYQRFNELGLLNVVVPPLSVTYDVLLKGNIIGMSTGILRASLARQLHFENIGHEDYLFWLQALKRVPEALRVPDEQPLSHYCVRQGSLSGNVWRNASWQWSIYRNHLQLTLVQSTWLMGHYAWRALAKRY